MLDKHHKDSVWDIASEMKFSLFLTFVIVAFLVISETRAARFWNRIKSMSPLRKYRGDLDFAESQQDPYASFRQFGPGVVMDVGGQLHYIRSSPDEDKFLW